MFSKWSSYFFGNNGNGDAVVDDVIAADINEDVVDNGRQTMNEPEQLEQPEQQQKRAVASAVKKSKKKDNQQQQLQNKKKNGALSKKSVVSAAAAKNYKTAVATAADTSAIVETKTQPKLSIEAAAAAVAAGSAVASTGDEEDWILLDDQKSGTVMAIEEGDSGFEISSTVAVDDAELASDETSVVMIEEEEQEEMVVLEAEKDDDGDGEEASIVDMSDVYKDGVSDDEDPELISLDLSSSAAEADDTWCVAQVPMSLSPVTSLNNNRFIPSKKFEMDAFNLPSFTTRIGLGSDAPATSMSFYNTNFVFFKNSDFKENCEPRSIVAAANDLEVTSSSSSPSKHKKSSAAAAAAAETAATSAAIKEAVVPTASVSIPAKSAKTTTTATATTKKRNRSARQLNIVVPPTQLVPNTNRIDRFDLFDSERDAFLINLMKNPKKLLASQHRTNKVSVRVWPTCDFFSVCCLSSP